MDVEIKKLDSKKTAEAIYNLNSEEQAEMFEHLHDFYGGDHFLMSQFLCTRNQCIDRGGIYGKAISAFQSMFSSAYKYMW